MSGWLAVWSHESGLIDDASWHAASPPSTDYSHHDEYVSPNVRLKTWRRATGEFISSGKLIWPHESSCVAWVGQTLDDSGEVTNHAQFLVSINGVSPAMAASINGPFAAAVYDQISNQLRVLTDRHRHYPVYFLQKSGLCIASTRYQSLLPWIGSLAVNKSAISLLLRCGECLDTMTVLSDIQMLPSATMITISDRGVSSNRYWRMNFEPDFDLDRSQLVDELAHSMSQSVRRIQTANPRLSVPLSGGLDSRFILGMCSHPDEINSFTWGDKGCRDISCAESFASRIGAPHHVEPWQPDTFPDHWAEGVELTAGNFGIRDMYVLPYVSLLARHADVTLNGYAGDALLGGNFVIRSWLKQQNMEMLANQTWRWRVTKDDDEWADQLLNDKGAPNGHALWVESLTKSEGARPIDRLHAWLFENRVERFTNCGSMLLRSGIETHAPFCDNNVIDLLQRVPLELKYKHRLYIDVLKRACPVAAGVPWQRTGIPPSLGYWPNIASMAFHRGMRIVAGRFGIDPFPAMKVADSASWFRGHWKRPFERIVLSDRSLSRGLLNPDAMRKAWQAHQDGADLSRLLGVLISLELFFEKTLD
ncbi:MAG: asparagine synthase C-terminal domain-containing protein [Candidatus Sedimenticola sp. (ex Thyasira tokunagai)]